MKKFILIVSYDGASLALDNIIRKAVGKPHTSCVGGSGRDLLFTFTDKVKRDKAVVSVRNIKNTKTLKVAVSET